MCVCWVVRVRAVYSCLIPFSYMTASVWSVLSRNEWQENEAQDTKHKPRLFVCVCVCVSNPNSLSHFEASCSELTRAPADSGEPNCSAPAQLQKNFPICPHNSWLQLKGESAECLSSLITARQRRKSGARMGSSQTNEDIATPSCH